MIWIRPTLCDDGLLNGVYFLDPYASVSVVTGRPLLFSLDVIAALAI